MKIRFFLYTVLAILDIPLMFIIGGSSFKTEFMNDPVLMSISVFLSIVITVEGFLAIERPD